MKLEKISYEGLNSRQKEIFNFQKVAGRLAEYGFNCIKLADDWQGADFLAYHKDGSSTLKVQLKSRATIDKKYQGKDLFLAFPIRKGKDEDWYLVNHDEFVAVVQEHTNWMSTDSWIEGGGYSSDSPSEKLVKELESCRLT